MSATTIRHSDVALSSARMVTSPARRLVNVRLRRALDVGSDVLLATAVVMGIPVIILAIGIPIALFVQLLLWIARLM
jgi:hypothetical protein